MAEEAQGILRQGASDDAVVTTLPLESLSVGCSKGNTVWAIGGIFEKALVSRPSRLSITWITGKVVSSSEFLERQRLETQHFVPFHNRLHSSMDGQVQCETSLDRFRKDNSAETPRVSARTSNFLRAAMCPNHALGLVFG
jgi:hypothetical protein